MSISFNCPKETSGINFIAFHCALTRSKSCEPFVYSTHIDPICTCMALSMHADTHRCILLWWWLISWIGKTKWKKKSSLHKLRKYSWMSFCFVFSPFFLSFLLAMLTINCSRFRRACVWHMNFFFLFHSCSLQHRTNKREQNGQKPCGCCFLP